jgi:hypothetical protein
MKLKKALLITGAASTVGLSSVVGVGVVSAQSNTQTNSSSSTSIVDEIAQKFNLNKQDVQAVFDQHHQEREAARQQKLQTALDKDVSEGKITSAQETLILDKLKELQSYRDSLKSKTPQERRQLMAQERSQLEQWAKDNNIPTGIAPFLNGPKQ